MIFGKSVKSAHDRVDQAESWSGRATLLILLGIVLDAAVLFIFPGGKSAEEIALSLAANIAIGVGLAVEFFCILAAVRANAEVKVESDAKLAEALDRATAAQLELAKIRSTRREDLQGKESEIAAKIAQFAGTNFDAAIGMGDGEQADFIWDLEPVLTNAGWKQLPWFSTAMGPNQVIFRGSSQRPALGNVSARHVEIHLAPSARTTLQPAADALISALNDNGIAARDAGYNINNGNTAAVHILIGPKR